MSSQSVRSWMSGVLRKVFSKNGEGHSEAPAGTAPVPVAGSTPAPTPTPAPIRSTIAPRQASAPVHRNGGSAGGKGIELPLQSVLSGLPLELQPHLKHSYSGSVMVSIPLEKILSQLSRGAVKISFGELRLAAPEVFTPDTDRDRVSVTLPLAEILPRLNPALITRRREQRQIEIPAEIASPFDSQGEGLTFTLTQAKGESAPGAGPARGTTPAPAAPVPPSAAATRNTITFTPTPAPPAAVPLSSPAISPASRAIRDLGAANPSLAPQAPIPMPAVGALTPPAPAALSTPITPLARSTPPAAPAAPKAVEKPSAPAAPAVPSESAPLIIGISVLADGWPDAVRREILQQNLTDAKLELPSENVERALRQGKIAFSWKVLRSWLKPVPKPGASAQDNTMIELPLKIVAPLFLARQHEANKAKKRIMVDEDIPNLFFGFPQPEAGSKAAVGAKPAATKTQDTNYYVWEDSTDRMQSGAPGAKQPSPGTKFVAKYATPNEVVSKASALDGVTGALIALPDGLMVASKLSGDLNADTLAAFLPQIFGKVNQCTKELRMGELNNLNFTVGNVPWKIFRVNAIFFAAFGRAGEPLPTAQLAALAAELDHKPK